VKSYLNYIKESILSREQQREYQKTVFEQENYFKTDILPIIEMNCSEYLDIVTEIIKEDTYERHPSNGEIEYGFLYRSIQLDPRYPFPQKGLSLRKFKERLKPSDTNVLIHNLINDLTEEQVGWRVRNGVFTTSSIVETERYGTKYIFLPIEDYKFAYDPNIHDLTDWCFDVIPDYFNMREWTMDDWNEKGDIDKVEEIIEKQVKYTDKDLKTAIKKGVEVIFKCDFYLLDTDYKSYFINYIKER